MANVISAEDLKKKMDGDESFHLIDALSENSFEGRHIPGAKNVPNGPDFLEKFEREIGTGKDEEIIVYCASATCPASVEAAKTLEEADYTNVMHFKDGLAGWQAAGYSLEGAAADGE